VSRGRPANFNDETVARIIVIGEKKIEENSDLRNNRGFVTGSGKRPTKKKNEKFVVYITAPVVVVCDFTSRLS